MRQSSLDVMFLCHLVGEPFLQPLPGQLIQGEASLAGQLIQTLPRVLIQRDLQRRLPLPRQPFFPYLFHFICIVGEIVVIPEGNQLIQRLKLG
jgi:hypothetical protein